MFGIIDFSEIQGGIISGLESEEINEISEVQQLIGNDANILSEPFDMISCNTLPDEIDEQLKDLEKQAIPTSTAKQQRNWTEKFTQFCKIHKLNNDFETISKRELSDNLRFFYSQLKTKIGACYSKSSLLCIRAALYRYFRSERLFDIINDPQFFHANQILKAMIKKYYEEGGIPKTFDAIEENDMKKLREFLNRETPEKLQYEVYFIIMYFLGLRGREWIKRLKRQQILFKKDSNGNEYIMLEGLNIIQKNDQPALENTQKCCKEGRIYATDNSDLCPVTALRLFLEKLPKECQYVFYKKNPNWKHSEYWYNSKMPMGVNTIGSLMKKISDEASLSKTYTGHCIRSTVVTNLFNKGVPLQEICCVTGHKESKSVKRYLRQVSDDKKSEYATALATSFGAGARGTSSTGAPLTGADLPCSSYQDAERPTTYSEGKY